MLLIALFAAEACTVMASTPRPLPSINSVAKPTASPAVSPAPSPAPSPESGPDKVFGDGGVYLVEKDGDNVTLSFTAAVKPGMSEYMFTVKGGGERYSSWVMYTTAEIEVRDTADGSLVFSETVDIESEDDYLGFHVTDLNFDGSLDIMLASVNAGAHGHYWYNAYLWDAKKKTFVLNESFSDICNATVDPDRQVILSIGADSAFDMYYGIYSYMDGAFVLEAELYEEIGRDQADDGRDISRYNEYRINDGERELVSSFEFAEGDGPDELLQYYREGSYWDLDNPLWTSGDHYIGRLIGIDPSYVGLWHSSPSASEACGERYHFKADGTFVFGVSDTDETEPTRYISGFWSAQYGELTLDLRERVYWDGEIPAYPITEVDIRDLTDSRAMFEMLNDPETVALDIGETKKDNKTGLTTVTIDNQVLYNLNNQTGLFDGYYQMKSEAVKKIAYKDEKTPLAERADEDVLIIDDDYGNPFPYVRGIVEQGIFYHDGRNEWITYYFVQLSPKQYQFYYDRIDGITPEPSEDSRCEVQVTGYGSVNLSGYVGKEIVFIGSAYEGHTIYHRRHIVIQVTEIVPIKE